MPIGGYNMKLSKILTIMAHIFAIMLGSLIIYSLTAIDINTGYVIIGFIVSSLGIIASIIAIMINDIKLDKDWE
jgi:hypothetical protein